MCCSVECSRLLCFLPLAIGEKSRPLWPVACCCPLFLFISFLGSTWVLNLGLPSIEPLVFALRRALTKLPRKALNLLCIVQEDLKHGSPLLLASQVIKIIGYATRLGLCPSIYLHCFPLILWTKASRNQILFKCFFPHHSYPIVPRSWRFCG